MMFHDTPRGVPALACALVLLALAGCAAPVRPGIDVAASAPAASSGDAARIGAAESGTRLRLGEDTLPGVPAVLVGERYFAASGRVCRRLADEAARPLGRIVCAEEGVWRFVRSLEPRGGSAAPEPVRGTSVEPARGAASPSARAPLGAPPGADAPPHVEEMVKRELGADETLWSFAERVTGAGDNWRRIAVLNGIDDTTRVGSGRRLVVPVELTGE